MRVYCLFFLIALCGAADDTTSTTSTTTSAVTSAVSSAVASASNLTIGGVLGKINSTSSSGLDGKHNIVVKGIELGNLTAQSIISLGAHAIGNATEMAQKGVDVALNMGRQSMNVARQVGNKTRELVEALPGSKFIPTSIISNATSFGVGASEKLLNSSLSAVKTGIKMGNNVGQTVLNKTSSAVSAVHDQVNKAHLLATNTAKSAINGTISHVSNSISGVGKWISRFGNRLTNSANITSSG
uniref:Uncharacterized protein n=3 Tax=Lygus hesperus TaxID=30085 RepID=A0A146L9C5_LYGHE